MNTCQALLAVCACAILPLHGADLSDLIYTTTDGKVTITDCVTGASGALIIPTTIKGKPVTSIGDNDTRQAVATRESTAPDAGDTIRDCDASQGAAPSEGPIPDAGDAIRNRNVRQLRIVIEGRIPNAGDRFAFDSRRYG